jgi:hypothetical protein
MAWGFEVTRSRKPRLISRAHGGTPARRVRLKTPSAVRDIPLLPQLAALLKRHKLAVAP